jgi:hypothetical protein
MLLMWFVLAVGLSWTPLPLWTVMILLGLLALIVARP